MRGENPENLSKEILRVRQLQRPKWFSAWRRNHVTWSSRLFYASGSKDFQFQDVWLIIEIIEGNNPIDSIKDIPGQLTTWVQEICICGQIHAQNRVLVNYHY